MRFKLMFDHSIPVDDEEIPEDIIVKADSKELGIDLLLEEINNVDPEGIWPIEDVLCDGKSILDEFNDKMFE